MQTLGALSQPLIGGLNQALSCCKPDLLPVSFPKGFSRQPATPKAELDAVLDKLDAKRRAWVNTGKLERATILRMCIKSSLQAAENAAKATEAAKGSYGAGHGEEFLLWVFVVWGLRSYAESLEAGAQPKPISTRVRDNDQTVAQVFPAGFDAILFGGMKGELWLQPGKPPSQGALYHDKDLGRTGQGSIGLVLGAGNQLPVVCFDIMHMLIAEDSVVICKMNPVNEYLGPFIRDAFLPFVQRGVLEVVYGSGSEGAYLCSHQKVSKIHLTGSADTYDAIVWGKQPKAKGQAPPCEKQVTAELGCVTPYIIVPGKWTRSDMEYYASEIVSGLVNNAGHNCTKVEVLVTDGSWPQRDEFLVILRDRLNDEPQRVAWYPGSEQRLVQAKKTISGLQPLGRRLQPGPEHPADDGDSKISKTPNGKAAPPTTYWPWLLSTGLSPQQAQTQAENWAGVLQEVSLPGTDASPQSFLHKAVEFCNKECWGTLSASIFVPPHVQKAHPEAVESAVADLQYGTVAVNAPSFVGFAVPQLAWGAYPGRQAHDIGSGNCFVHNTLLFDHVQKSVLWSPWRTYPTHLYDTRNRNLIAAARAVTSYAASPNICTLTFAALAALRS